MSIINKVKIENTELIRDMDTQAVLSTDVAGLRSYQEQRRRVLGQRKEMQETKLRLESIEQEMASLKRIVGELSTLRSRG
jgi:hypothetical protein